MLSKEVKCWPDFYKYVERLKDIGEFFLQSKTNFLLITNPIERLILLITIIVQYSSAKEIHNINSVPIQAYPSPLILKSLGNVAAI